jgi:hypothetical protein
VLAWVARGKTNAEIARLLWLAPSTVGKHLETSAPSSASVPAQRLWPASSDRSTPKRSRPQRGRTGVRARPRPARSFAAAPRASAEVAQRSRRAGWSHSRIRQARQWPVASATGGAWKAPGRENRSSTRPRARSPARRRSARRRGRECAGAARAGARRARPSTARSSRSRRRRRVQAPRRRAHRPSSRAPARAARARRPHARPLRRARRRAGAARRAARPGDRRAQSVRPRSAGSAQVAQWAG